MRLRAIIKNPSRYDEEVIDSDPKKSTKPAYPKLLAEKVIPFNLGNKGAAFPSLPLTTGSISSASSQIPDEKNYHSVDVTSNIFSEHPITDNASRDGVPQDTGSLKDHQLDDSVSILEPDVAVHMRKSPELGHLLITWDILAPSLQQLIYSSLLNEHGNVMVVADRLGLSCEELDTVHMAYQNRKIHSATTEQIWTYCAEVSDNKDMGYVEPGVLQHYLDYFAFASLYDPTSATAEEVAHAKGFLRQREVNNRILEQFGDRHSRLWIKPGSALHESERDSRTRESPSTDITTVDPGYHKQGSERCVSGTSTDCSTGFTSAAKSNRRKRPHDSGYNSADGDHISNNSTLHPNKRKQRILLKIDKRTGRADVNICDANNVRSSTEHDTMHVHKYHDSNSFAAHFKSRYFPAAHYTYLLSKSPVKMTSLEYWLVYGTNGDSRRWRESSTRNLSSTMIFDPKLTSHLTLKWLVCLHNSWVEARAYDKTPVIAMVEHFGHAACLWLYTAARLQSNCQAFTIFQESSQYSNIEKKIIFRAGGMTTYHELRVDISYNMLKAMDTYVSPLNLTWLEYTPTTVRHQAESEYKKSKLKLQIPAIHSASDTNLPKRRDTTSTDATLDIRGSTVNYWRWTVGVSGVTDSDAARCCSVADHIPGCRNHYGEAFTGKESPRIPNLPFCANPSLGKSIYRKRISNSQDRGTISSQQSPSAPEYSPISDFDEDLLFINEKERKSDSVPVVSRSADSQPTAASLKLDITSGSCIHPYVKIQDASFRCLFCPSEQIQFSDNPAAAYNLNAENRAAKGRAMVDIKSKLNRAGKDICRPSSVSTETIQHLNQVAELSKPDPCHAAYQAESVEAFLPGTIAAASEVEESHTDQLDHTESIENSIRTKANVDIILPLPKIPNHIAPVKLAATAVPEAQPPTTPHPTKSNATVTSLETPKSAQKKQIIQPKTPRTPLQIEAAMRRRGVKRGPYKKTRDKLAKEAQQNTGSTSEDVGWTVAGVDKPGSIGFNDPVTSTVEAGVDTDGTATVLGTNDRK